MTDGSLETIRHSIKGFIQQRFPAFTEAEIDDRAPLLEGGAIDSLGLLDLVAHVEETFGIGLDDDELSPENFETVEQLAQFVSAKQAGLRS